ncbi:T9SS type A sorting domain-containing protein [Hymenobacter sp. BT770]|uniref:T9SS type A sorting domain-containing protein n=1 Tax=Hymenobacter sp. BT770 TaxID=2886942 RepID=UPI001D11A2B4|nr:T9SS type A sorting domain-containing protein [Hymenobacter sp. BT770]MCC3154878.1 T9SS type A sorting domain-containing protein [Hymenobacter sp. BT770]MDO3415597.1 T9SS type A sorting domain-containing protein [Hymenobacter sp. BT770]
MATDASGNVYLAGVFRGTVQFGSTTLTNTGSTSELYLAKWSSSTNSFVWAQRLAGGGTSAFLTVNSMAVQGTGIYLAGSFNSTIDFGSASLVSAGDGDGFIAKLTDTGTNASFTWAQQAGGPTEDDARALVVNGASVYVAGSFSGATARFGSVQLSSAGSQDMYVAKLSDAGTSSNYVWALRAGGVADDFAQAVAVQGTSVYVAGSTTSPTASFGGSTLANAGLSDVVVAKLSDAGTSASFVWAQGAGGPSNDRAVAMSVNGPNVYVAGTFESSTASFGSATLTNATPVGSQATDLFVTKLTDAGTTGSFTWARQAGGPSNDFVNSMALNGSYVYLAGNFSSDKISFGNSILTNVGYNGINPDVFVSKLTDAGATGTFAWAQQAGGSNSDQANEVAVSNTSVYVAGLLQPPANFGNYTISGLSSTSSVAYLAYLPEVITLATTSPTWLEGVSVFPNPAHIKATVLVPAVPGATSATLTVLDALGRSVRTQIAAISASDRQVELDLTGLPAGLYAVRLTSGSRTDTRRLVVE